MGDRWQDKADAVRLAVIRLRALPASVKDTAIAALVTVLSFTPGFSDKGTVVGWSEVQRPFDLLAVALVLTQALPLALRSRLPALCLALVSSAFFVYQALGYRATFASVALYVALYSAGMLQTRCRIPAVVLWTVSYVAMSAWLVHAGSPFPPRDFTLFVVLPLGCWLLGAWSRSRLRDQARVHRHRVEAELNQERERIAGELHDVVTHHVTAMVMQADAAQYVPVDDRAKLEAGLKVIGSTGRRALADLRELLGVLTPEGDARPASKQPVLGRVVDLVEQTKAAGQPVEFVEDAPAPAITGSAQLAVYRVLQEGLTNALKHASGRRTLVRLHNATPEEFLVEVVTAGDHDHPTPRRGLRPAPSGRGLDGLRQRVTLAGGSLTTHREQDGGFVLTARFPTTGEVR